MLGTLEITDASHVIGSHCLPSYFFREFQKGAKNYMNMF